MIFIFFLQVLHNANQATQFVSLYNDLEYVTFISHFFEFFKF